MRRFPVVAAVAFAVLASFVSASSLSAGSLSSRIVSISYPAWSPTRAEIAFDARFDDGSSAVVVMAPDGSQVRRLTQVGEHPVWSPNGNRLAVLGYDGGGNVVRVVNRDGTSAQFAEWGVTAVIDPETTWHPPSWAPDSERLTFNHEDPTYSPDGLRVARVGDLSYAASLEVLGYAPAWSPRGDLIAYSILHCTCRSHHCGDRIDDGGNCGRWPYPQWAVLYAKAPNGTRRRRLFRGENAAWSSDGNLLAFTAPGGIYVARPNGKERRLVFRASVAPAGESMQPLWAPHRPLIALRRPLATYVIDVRHRLVRRVTGRTAGTPTWSPDGRRLAFADGARLYIIGANDKGGHYVEPKL
jgi:Tol biopolymer transport system component